MTFEDLNLPNGSENGTLKSENSFPNSTQESNVPRKPMGRGRGRCIANCSVAKPLPTSLAPSILFVGASMNTQERSLSQPKSQDSQDDEFKENYRSLVESVEGVNLGTTTTDTVDKTQLLKRTQTKENSQENQQRNEMARRSAKFTSFKESLPIFKYKNELLELLETNQVVVVMGETGSGKTTQITQYLFEAGYGRDKKIGCTQPRKVAARSVATRVALEMGTNLGDVVGYKVRFDSRGTCDTVIEYMTDGLLLRELCSEPDADTYSVLMLDEAHERSIHTDIAIGLLKRTLRSRKDLKVLVTSATLNCEKFSNYFDGAPILKIPGRLFPVVTFYSCVMNEDYMRATIDAVDEVHNYEDAGDVLVFLTGEEEIERACVMVSHQENMLALPLYSNLPIERQSKVFEPAPKGVRKVIFATNIAETSVTIEGIVYVIDSGFSKQREYNPNTGIDSIVVKRISKAQAIQRAGRAGRTRAGKVYRLYTKEVFKRMDSVPIPEIQRVNIESIMLQLGAMGISDILQFKFMDSPSIDTAAAGMEHLLDLLAFRQSEVGLELTDMGLEMSAFPLEPALAKVLIKSQHLGCSEEILTIVALLSTQNQNVFFRPKDNLNMADKRIWKFHHKKGDHFMLLNVYNQWAKNNYSRKWCNENFVKSRRLEEAKEIRRQLLSVMAKREFKMASCGDDYSKVQQAICSGYFQKVATKNFIGHGYMTYDGASASIRDKVFIHPSSCMFIREPNWVIYHEIFNTKKPYMRQVMELDPEWLSEQCPSFYRKLDRRFPGLLAPIQIFKNVKPTKALSELTQEERENFFIKTKI